MNSFVLFTLGKVTLSSPRRDMLVTNGLVMIGESGVYGDVVITVLFVLRLQDAVYHEIIWRVLLGITICVGIAMIWL